jgi:hypothetical protein
MRWLDDVSMDLRMIGVNEWRDNKESRGLEAYCRGGQGPPRAVAPSGDPQVIGVLTKLWSTWI